MIIGLHGPLQAGKDTVASYLAEEYEFEQRRFAQKIREITTALLNLPPDEYENFKLHGTVKLEYGIGPHYLTGREFLERLGTEVGRNILGWDFWVDITLPRDTPPWDNIVISDVRFENEANRVRSLEGYIIEILREGTDYKEGHESRKRLPEHLVDFVYDNSGTLDELYVGIDRILSRIFTQERV